MSRMGNTDMAGFRCLACDPVVRATTYGGKRDPFVKVVDSLNADGSISRIMIAKANIQGIEVTVSFVPPPPVAK